MKRIKVIIPVQTELWNWPHEQELSRYKDPDTEIAIVSLKSGSESVECAYDDMWNALLTVLDVERAEREGFDGAIISCFGDPGLLASKEAVSIPVVGVAEASIHLASMLNFAANYEHGHFVKLVPNEQVIEVDEFETTDPMLQGEMKITITLTDADGGTDVFAMHDGLPPGLSTEDNETGWRMALAKLAALVEET